ncbi:MAG TPA: helix-hairpin-helix domain-containing protein [Puia sp.]|nr:helix-hairpin-helix domain-containing protein [Puia sp.]
MITDNYYIADQFSLLAKLMDIHGENSFKTKSYSVAAFTIEKLPALLTEMPPEKIFTIKGIGDAIGKKIQEIIATGELRLLREYLEKTPPGVIELLNIKGLGPKKIATIWKEMEIESLGELLYACQENRLLLYKGFGEKTQNNVKDAIEFYFKSQGSHLYADVEAYALALDAQLKETFSEHRFALTGEFRRQLEVINQLQWVTTLSQATARSFFENNGFSAESEPLPASIDTTSAPAKSGSELLHGAPSELISLPVSSIIRFKGPEGVRLEFLCSTEDEFTPTLFATSCSGEFLEAWEQRTHWDPKAPSPSEEQIFSSFRINFIPSYQRERAAILEEASLNILPTLIQAKDIRSVIHSHSNWSDGSNTLEEMAKACIERGYEYLVISDHSKSAFYANGLNEERIREQHVQIGELNRQLAPFTIFKSIECDILNDGALDYSDPILSTFDLVIASVHSNLKMSEEKAMNRLLNAIANPYTTILGHMTGRLLLSRPGYPVDHRKIIEACAEHHVTIELNAHPRRLDMDWRWIAYAIEKGVLISIDPDAHSTEGCDVIKYGVLAAQKAGLTPKMNLSSYSLEEFRAFLAERKKAFSL